jgi:hypothetical protein
MKQKKNSEERRGNSPTFSPKSILKRNNRKDHHQNFNRTKLNENKIK